jgi:hypothetical protein
VSHPAARTKRTTSENKLETDPAVRLFLFLGTAAAAYALSLFTPYGTGHSAWIAAIFVAGFYDVPLNFEKDGLGNRVLEKLKMKLSFQGVSLEN